MPRTNRKNVKEALGAAGFLQDKPQDKPHEQQADIPVEQDTSTPSEGIEEGDKPNFKVTYYITKNLDLKLEQIRLARRTRGIRVDKSELIREAIDLLHE